MYPTLPTYLSLVFLLFSFCLPQVKQRASECILALNKLTEINSGVPVQNVLQTQFDWTTLEVIVTSTQIKPTCVLPLIRFPRCVSVIIQHDNSVVNLLTWITIVELFIHYPSALVSWPTEFHGSV